MPGRNGFLPNVVGIGQTPVARRGGPTSTARTIMPSTGLLFGVDARDPATFAAVPALRTIVAVVAAWGPARRASRLDPLTALRAE